MNVFLPCVGFCRAGKDIRLMNYERDCSEMCAFPGEFVLLALQISTNQDVGNLIVVAINLKSLPQPNSSSQGLLLRVSIPSILATIFF